MISPDVFTFLRDLNQNNNREWFNEHKPRYQEAQHNILDTVGELLLGINAFDPGLADLQPKDCVFRIYKDVRFSKDKLPYKNNMGAFFVEGGKKSGNAGYYLHLQPGASFIGGGMHVPPGPVLKAIRTEIYNFPEDILEVLQQPDFKNTFGSISGDQLKKAPQGFDAEFEHVDLLKFKSYTVFHEIDDDALFGERGLEMVLEHFRIMQPFIQFLNKAVKENS